MILSVCPFHTKPKPSRLCYIAGRPPNLAGPREKKITDDKLKEAREIKGKQKKKNNPPPVVCSTPLSSFLSNLNSRRCPSFNASYSTTSAPRIVLSRTARLPPPPRCGFSAPSRRPSSLRLWSHRSLWPSMWVGEYVVWPFHCPLRPFTSSSRY